MATQTIKNFNPLDLETLASVEGGFSCDEGMLAVGALGAAGGPWGAVGGVLVGAALYCF